MSSLMVLISIMETAAFPGVGITFPEDGGAYSSPEMNVRAVLDYENLLADSVAYSLNGGAWTLLPRMDTDWYTYMQNDLHHGFSESAAPHDATVLWTAPVTGTIHEFPNPVIVDGIVYYPSNSGTDSLYALDALTGEILWKYFVGSTDDAVTVIDGLLYVASDSLYCLDALSGSEIWASCYAGGSGSTPAVAGGKVYAGWRSSGSSAVSRFDAFTGELEWTTSIDGLTVSCLTIWEGRVFVPSYCGENPSPLYALDASTGEIVWATPIEGGFWDSSPVVVDSTIYICSMLGSLLAIDCLNGEILWTSPIGGETNATPAYNDGHLYVGDTDSTFARIDALSGAIEWIAHFNIHGSPCVADGLVFFGEVYNEGENVMVIALDCVTGETVWTYTVEAEMFMSTPAVTDGIMYIAAIDGNLYAFGTGFKFSYDAPITAEIGWNELIVEAYCLGGTVHADTVSFLVDPYGIEEEPGRPAIPELRILQNPASSSVLMVLMSPSSAAADVRVFDLSGRMLVDSDIPEGSNGQMGLDVSGMPPGVYLVRWTQEGVSGTTRLVVLR